MHLYIISYPFLIIGSNKNLADVMKIDFFEMKPYRFFCILRTGNKIRHHFSFSIFLGSTLRHQAFLPLQIIHTSSIHNFRVGVECECVFHIHNHYRNLFLILLIKFSKPIYNQNKFKVKIYGCRCYGWIPNHSCIGPLCIWSKTSRPNRVVSQTCLIWADLA